MKNFDELIQAGGKKAIRHYWKTRTGQLAGLETIAFDGGDRHHVSLELAAERATA